MKTDYIIVGQGIAGSVMALTLRQAGRSVLIVDAAGKSSSSAIAAGVYNPFNFRRSMPVWKAEEAASMASRFYAEAEQVTGVPFHVSTPIVRVFQSEKEAAEWGAYITFPGARFAQSPDDAGRRGAVITPYGSGMLSGGGVVNTERLISATRTLFDNQGYYINEHFDHPALIVGDNGVQYRSVEARKIIFCEGHLASGNSFFPERSIVPTKGELIHISVPGLNESSVINGPVYLAPLGNDEYVCGATFNPGRSDEEKTAQGRDELLTKLRTFVDLPCTVIRHLAGVRPAGRDRKPVIGLSSGSHNVAIFNGFGSKGVLMAPYLAQLLVNHVENQAEIPAEINIRRFGKGK